MSVFLIANIEVNASGFAAFTRIMSEVVAIVEAAGWTLASAYVLRTGPLNTVIDIWELDDFNHMDVGMKAVAQHRDFPRIQAVLHETIVRETLSLADKLTYPG